MQLKNSILVIEDNVALSRIVAKALEDEGFSVGIASTGKEGLRLVDKMWALVILDLMLPDLEGTEILKYIQSRRDHAPVLVLTAKNRLEDKLSLFRLGCDDYLTKPFEIEELLERVRALLRRSWKSSTEGNEYEGLFLNMNALSIKFQNKNVSLTPKEAQLCQLLMREPQKIVTRREILHSVWGLTNEPQTNFLGVHILNLRKKLTKVGCGDWLQTVRGSGVFLSPEKEAKSS